MCGLDLGHFKQLCNQHGHFTRLVACSLVVEYAPYQEVHASEYENLGSLGAIQAPNWEVFYGKDREDVILRALSEIYAKLNHLEQMMNEQQINYLPLESQSTLEVLGHGILGTNQANFEPSQTYYMRFKLPHMPYKRIPIIARAFDSHLLHITRMHPRDVKDFDGFIAKRELESLKKAD